MAGNSAGTWLTPVATFTRPSDTADYVLGDLVANNTSSGSVVPLTWQVSDVAGGGGMIRRMRLSKTGTSTTNAQFRVHVFQTTSTSLAQTNGDNGAFISAGSTGFLGAFDVTMDKTYRDGAAGIGTPLQGSELIFQLGSTAQNLLGYVEARAGYSPVSAETFTAIPEIGQS